MSEARQDVVCDFLSLIAFCVSMFDNMEWEAAFMRIMKNRLVGRAQADFRQCARYFLISYDDPQVQAVFAGLFDNIDNGGVSSPKNGDLPDDCITFWIKIFESSHKED